MMDVFCVFEIYVVIKPLSPFILQKYFRMSVDLQLFALSPFPVYFCISVHQSHHRALKFTCSQLAWRLK